MLRFCREWTDTTSAERHLAFPKPIGALSLGSALAQILCEHRGSQRGSLLACTGPRGTSTRFR